MKLPRRRFLQMAAGVAALPVSSPIAWAQTYPTRPVRWIVGFAAGNQILDLTHHEHFGSAIGVVHEGFHVYAQRPGYCSICTRGSTDLRNKWITCAAAIMNHHQILPSMVFS